MRSYLIEDSVKIVTGYIDEEPVTSCMTLNFGAKSIYMVAATGLVGRKINSAYAMVPKLFETLRDCGISILILEELILFLLGRWRIILRRFWWPGCRVYW